VNAPAAGAHGTTGDRRGRTDLAAPPRPAVDAAGPDSAMEDLMESEPRRLGSLPTGLPQRLGNRCAIPTAPWKTLRVSHSDHSPDDGGKEGAQI
jgi:hypothetical protein